MKFAPLLALPLLASGHGAVSFGDDCSAAAEGAGQACHLEGMLRALLGRLGCPSSQPELCGMISQTLDVLDGQGPPLFAEQAYLLESLDFLRGYSKSFYSHSDKSCAAGDESSCQHRRADYPGPEAQSYLSASEIAAKMTEVPSRQAAGDITRRNMLGYLLLNDMYWYDLPAGEQGLGLGGQSVELHRFVRPKLDAAFGDGAWDAASIESSARDFLRGRSRVNFQQDVKVWTQQVLHRVLMGAEISEQEAEDFVDFQGKVLKTVVVPQFLVDAARAAPGGEALLKGALGFAELKAKKDDYLQRWLPATRARYCQGCDDHWAKIVNSNFLDALIFAGGLSVPGVIAPGTAVLYAGSQSPAPGMQLNAGNVEAFAWEAARYFPPVLGFPYVDEGESRPLQIMAVGMGQRSGAEWGEDAEKPTFRLRDMATYQRWWVGHADHAEDPTGEMTRRCPGKHLSMAMIAGWFKAWDQAAWAPTRGTHFKFNDFVLFVLDFTLERVARDDDLLLV